MQANVLVETEGLSREEWLKYRRQGVGGSDVAAILGISKWMSPVALWLDKTGQTDETEEVNEAMRWGTILEPVIREQFRQITGKPVVEVNAILQHPQYPYLLANIDGLTVDDNGDPAILEIKNVSEYKRGAWSDGVPAYYQTQVQHYLFVSGVAKAYVIALFGGNSSGVFTVDADPEVQEMLLKVETDFWNKVQNMIRPEIDGSDASTELLNSLYHGGKKEEVILPAEAVEYVDAYISASADEDSAKARKANASNHLKEIMGDYEKASCAGHTISWKPVTSERLDSKALKATEPEIYGRYIKASTSRRFTLS